jgi:hypothetical protein
MPAEIEGLKQRWEVWRWAKRKGMIQEEEFPEAERLLIERRCAQAVSAAEKNGDMRQLAGAYSRLYQRPSSRLNFRRPEKAIYKGASGRYAVSALLLDRRQFNHAHSQQAARRGLS